MSTSERDRSGQASDDPLLLPTTPPGDRSPAPAPAGRLRAQLLAARASNLAGRVTAALGRWPWWVQVGVVYLLSRVVTTAVFVAVARHQSTNPWTPSEPDYGAFINIWDSAWYQRIYDSGYPPSIPRNPDGSAQENAWAFYALFPYLVRGLTAVTGLGWTVLAPTVAVVAGLGAVLIIHRLFRLVAGPADSLAAVTLICLFPVSAVLQVPYAESLHLMLLAGALYLLARHRYLTAAPVVVAMCLTRPAGLPFALLVAVHLLLRWRSADFPWSHRVRGLALLAVAIAGGWAWPVIAWLVTGQTRAYTDTETAWRGGGGLELFVPWFDSGRWILGPVFGPIAVVLLGVVTVLVLLSPPVRRLGSDLQGWCLCYALYLAAVLHPQTSTFRLLLPLFPLALAAVLASRSRAYRITLGLGFLALQIVWVSWLWRYVPLPGGGDYPP
ncbi:hypothetical protein GCM10011512_29400 [Tersicoccus solisilvae]|uniref:Glycosyltransferase RgtA/B/C/D-like domain-containing protein n=1 Tax=Tersicoccus solisilvae TaxID=1882339 RepID=A0ABQ1PPH1_9MICC|nr:hypothetical protein [Tersicoccus solisilvae]GGD00644.1 hypothetical protein GCM10011512_29400 [Tersicoccus solisilvae]